MCKLPEDEYHFNKNVHCILKYEKCLKKHHQKHLNVTVIKCQKLFKLNNAKKHCEILPYVILQQVLKGESKPGTSVFDRNTTPSQKGIVSFLFHNIILAIVEKDYWVFIALS